MHPVERVALWSILVLVIFFLFCKETSGYSTRVPAPKPAPKPAPVPAPVPAPKPAPVPAPRQNYDSPVPRTAPRHNYDSPSPPPLTTSIRGFGHD